MTAAASKAKATESPKQSPRGRKSAVTQEFVFVEPEPAAVSYSFFS